MNHTDSSSHTSQHTDETPQTSRRARQFQGALAAAMRPGTPYSHLRELVEAGKAEGYPIEDLYQEAAEGALRNRGLAVPSYPDLTSGKQGTVV